MLQFDPFFCKSQTYASQRPSPITADHPTKDTKACTFVMAFIPERMCKTVALLSSKKINHILITNNLEPIRSAAWVINIIEPVSTAKVNPNILTDIPKRDIALKSILGHTPNSIKSIKTTLPNNIPMPQICKDSTVG